jgi:HlyD family secretion protein
MTTTTLTPSTVRRPPAARKRLVRWIKRGALGLAGCGVIAAAIYAWMPRPVVVEIGTAQRRPLVVEVDEDGQTRVRDRFVVFAPIGGTLERIAIEPGNEVQRDQVVARIRPPRSSLLDPRSHDEATARLAAAIARQRRAETSITRATAARDHAHLEAERTRTLASHNAVAVAELDERELAERLANADVTTAELDRSAARAEVEAARADLGGGPPHATQDSVDVVAPVHGRVLRRVRDSAGPVAPGEPLVELGDPQDLEIVVDVLSSDAAQIAAAMPVELEGWGGDRVLRGHVRVVEPSGFTRISALGVEEQRVKVIVALDEIPAALGDGFRVEARIVLWRGDALSVPASAVFRDHEHWAVYAVQAGRAHVEPVEVGHRGRLDVEITSGLRDGAAVIVHPSDQVVEGARVTAR